jgi:4-hydroxy-3-polyprenylbenzoate decarboxylase
MKTIAGIANGYTENLLLRAADVAIKEKRPLVLVARETPLSPIHLKNLSYLSTLHNISIVPPVLTYYGNQTTVADMEDHIIGKIFNLLGLSYEPFCTWNPNRASN